MTSRLGLHDRSICSGRICWLRRLWMKARSGRPICRRASGSITGRGTHLAGGTTIIAEAAVDSIPVYVKQGAVLPKLPDDVMTLVPASESGNKTIKSMDDRRVYEVVGEAACSPSTLVDFEGRTIARTGNSLSISGAAARCDWSGGGFSKCSAPASAEWRFGSRATQMASSPSSITSSRAR